MPLMYDANGCLSIRDATYCKSNITLIFFDGVPRNRSDCTLDTCSLEIANFGYLPNVPGNLLYMVLFLIFCVANIPLGLWKKTWGVMIGLSVGCLFEALGYIGRYQAHSNPFLFRNFVFYLIFITIGPAFLSAAIYLCLSRIIVVYGESNSRIKPAIYSYIFMFSDFVALVLQGAGGGLAATNSGVDEKKSKMGIDIMIAGLIWQVVSLTLFAIAAADIAICVRKAKGKNMSPKFQTLRGSKRWIGFLWALSLSVFFIWVRSIYRTIELFEGFTGPIADAEIPFMFLEGVMILLSVFLQTGFHPSFVMGDLWSEADYRNQKTIEHTKEMGTDMYGYPPYKQ